MQAQQQARRSELRRIAHNTHHCPYQATIMLHNMERDVTVRRTMTFLNFAHMVALLTMWNAQQPERYVYWKASE
ncbi:hypothetical protein [Bradyrhizobium sp. SZCCHNRI2049]|uniref:hypothetical protein n=1 Tax=Bradyrhizobium sp. SZCCHNRI2049 TaxID=3057287 RepID=UPI0029164F2E|nr:hypothetical protein [Bradyrhizobium sp. SZCCHNRI2049]